MKLSDKKSRKTVSFDARDVLERYSENMEQTTALMDKMYIGCFVENVVIIVIEVMDEVEVILEEEVFEVGPVVTSEETIVEIEV